MKKLLQINICLNLSTGTIAEEIGQKAIMRGWDSYIAFGRNKRESKSKTIKVGNKFDLYWHVLITRLFDRHGFASKRATKNLIKQIEQIQPDIIHLHNIHGYYLNVKVLFEYLQSADAQVVWTLHDCWAFTGHCYHYSFVKCDKWKTHCQHCPQLKEYPASYLVDNSFINYRDKRELFTSLRNLTLIPVSVWLGSQVRSSFLKNYPMNVIHNGIDTDVFLPTIDKAALKRKYELENKTILLGVASQWGERKGLNDFIRLSEKLPNDFLIVLIGLTKKQINRLPANIKGISVTENKHELVEYYSLADVFVNLTLEDSFPTVNLEALSCGTPVVTYRSGGSPEAISNEVGVAVEQGNIEKVLESIFDIVSREEGYYQNVCRQKVLTSFNKDERFIEYVDLYDNLLRK